MNDYVYEDVAVGGKRRNLSLGIYMDTCIHKSPRIEVYESNVFGRCLYLDSSLQTCTRDEHFYHEPLAHIPIKLAHKAKRVLIVGGGDGGTLREVLKHDGVEKVVLCEINRDVVDVSIKHLPEFDLERSLKDSRVELQIADGVKYVKEFVGDKFDVIIVDCPDPSIESSPLHSRAFFESAIKILEKDGAFGIQSGNAFIKEEAVRADKYELRRLFNHVEYYYAPVPSFPSGGIGFVFAFNESKRIRIYDVDTKYLTSSSVSAGFQIFPKSLYQGPRASFITSFEHEYQVDKMQFMIAQKFCEFEDEPKQKAFRLFEVEQAAESIPTVTFLTVDNVDKINPLIHMLMEVRGEKPPGNRIFNGFSLNQTGTAYHSIVTKAEFEGSYPDLAKWHDSPVYDLVLLTFSYVGGELIETKSRVADASREYEVSRTEGEIPASCGFVAYKKSVREKFSSVKDLHLERLTNKWAHRGWKMTTLKYEKPFGWVATYSPE